MVRPKLLIYQNMLFIGCLFAVMVFLYLFISSSQYVFIQKHVNQSLQTELNNVLADLEYTVSAHHLGDNVCVFDEQAYLLFKSRISSKTYFGKGYPFIINKKGDLLVHPHSEGENIRFYEHGIRILESTTLAGTFEYKSRHNAEQWLMSYEYFQQYNVYVCFCAPRNDCYEAYYKFRKQIILGLVLLFIISSYLFFSFNKSIVNIFYRLKNTLNNFADNNFEIDKLPSRFAELDDIKNDLQVIRQNYEDNLMFSHNIGEDDLRIPNKVNTNDPMTNNLLKIKENMEAARLEEASRKKEDEIQNWVNQGLAKFSDVLRQNSENIEQHSDNVIQNLVRYINVNQGALFLINREKDSEHYLELISAFAYETKKYEHKRFPYGEGLIGTCAIERKSIYLKEIPENYISITSGLGEASPRYLLLVPMKLEEEILGVVELASFNEIEDYKIKFVEKIMESVASTLESARITAQTNDLLKKFEQQSKEMAEKEEMMEQSIEELEATQEESSMKEFELQTTISAFARTTYMVEYRLNGQITDVSKLYLNVLGMNKPVCLNKTVFDGFKEEKDAEAMREAWATIVAGEEFRQTATYRTETDIFVATETYVPIKTEQGLVIRVLKISNIVSRELDPDK